jgi:hypothetical protein
MAGEAAGNNVNSFELMPRFGIELVLHHASGCRDPLTAVHPLYVLIELSPQQSAGLCQILEDLLERAAERSLLVDAVIAESLEHAKGVLAYPRSVCRGPVSCWRLSIRHDVSVPVAAVTRRSSSTLMTQLIVSFQVPAHFRSAT